MSSILFRRTSAVAAAGARTFSASAPRSVARISIIGHLADTPEVQMTTKNREVIKYAIASNSGPKDNRITSWFRVSCFVEGPRRDFLLSLPKGAMVFVEGEASMHAYTDANGQNRSNLNIVHRNIDLLKRPATEQSE